MLAGVLRRRAVSRHIREGLPETQVLRRVGWSDPWTLTRLGLYHTALTATTETSTGWNRAARLISLAATGKPGDTRPVDLLSLPAGARSAVAAALGAAGHQMTGEGSLSAALRLALSVARKQPDLGLLSALSASMQDTALAAAALAAAGRHREARIAASRLVPGGQELLNDSDLPLRMGDFVRRSTGKDIDGRPVLTFIIPARDATATIGNAVRSVLSQSWPAVEALVVDDASGDGTADTARSAAAGDPRFRVVVLEHRRGPYGARNMGVAEAGGQFVTFLDADDVALPDRASLSLRPLLDGPHHAGALSRLVRLDERGVFSSPRIWPLVRVNPASLTMSIEQFRKVGPFLEDIVGADAEYLSRVKRAFDTITVLGLATVVARRDGSLTESTGFPVTGLGASRRVSIHEAWVRRHYAEQFGEANTFPPMSREHVREAQGMRWQDIAP